MPKHLNSQPRSNCALRLCSLGLLFSVSLLPPSLEAMDRVPAAAKQSSQLQKGYLASEMAKMKELEEPFPVSTCDSPYRDNAVIFEFFEKSIKRAAVSQGHEASGITDLFAIAELRLEMQGVFPSFQEENPIDRLIAAQLCRYQQIQVKESPGEPNAAFFVSSDPALHKHLLGIADPFYRDARTLMVEALALRARIEKNADKLDDNNVNIIRARQAGRAKIEGLLDAAAR